MSSPMSPGPRRLSAQVLIWDLTQEASETERLSDNSSPSIILLYTWADAQPRHYLKYIEGYQKLFPRSKIILTRATTMGTFFGGQKAAQRVVQDMVDQELLPMFINDEQSADTAALQPRILAHALSNSGALNFEATISIWHQALGPNKPLPLTALVLDSTPGGEGYQTEFKRWTTGVALGFKFLPKPVAWCLAATIVTFLMVIPQMLGFEIMAVRGPRALNLQQNIPLESKRLYIYSTTDPLISHQAVEAHAQNAMTKGYSDVRLERFEGSVHVSHLRLDPERYWNAIWKMWNTRGRL